MSKEVFAIVARCLLCLSPALGMLSVACHDGGISFVPDGGEIEDSDGSPEPGGPVELCRVSEPMIPLGLPEGGGGAVLAGDPDSNLFLGIRGKVTKFDPALQVVWSVLLDPLCSHLDWLTAYRQGVLLSYYSERNGGVFVLVRLGADGATVWEAKTGLPQQAVTGRGHMVYGFAARTLVLPDDRIVLVTSIGHGNAFLAEASNRRQELKTRMEILAPTGETTDSFDFETAIIPGSVIPVDEQTVAVTGETSEPFDMPTVSLLLVGLDGAVTLHRKIAQTHSDQPELDPTPPGLQLLTGPDNTVLAAGTFTEQMMLFGQAAQPVLLEAPTLWNGVTQVTLPNHFAAQYDAGFELHWAAAGDLQENPQIDFDNFNYVSTGFRTFRVDDQGGILLAGSLHGQVTFDQESIGLSEDDGDSYIARYRSDGLVDWARKIDVTPRKDADSYPSALAVLPNGDIVLAMGLSGKVDIELADGTTHELESPDEENAYTYYLLELCSEQ